MRMPHRPESPVPAPPRRRPRLAPLAALAALLASASCVAVDGGAPAPGTAPGPAPGVGRVPPPPPAPVPRPPLPGQDGRLRAEPERLDFESVEVGWSATLQLALENDGWGPLWVRDVTIGDSRSFSIEEDGCAGRTLRPREECRVEVRFAPREPGRVSGILRVTSNDPERPHLDLRASGAGVPPRRADISLRPARLSFGEVAAGKDRILEAEVFNGGGAPLRVRATSVSGKGFRVVSDLCSRSDVAPGRACRIAVRFTPPAPGSFDGELRVVSDDQDERTVASVLEGRGIAPRPRCPQQRLDPLRGERGEERTEVVRGRLPRGECLTYAARAQEDGRLVVCVPPGYRLDAAGFELLEEAECRLGDDPTRYRAYRSGPIERGTDVDDLTISRRDDAERDFAVILRFRPRREDRGRDGRDDD